MNLVKKYELILSYMKQFNQWSQNITTGDAREGIRILLRYLKIH